MAEDPTTGVPPAGTTTVPGAATATIDPSTPEPDGDKPLGPGGEAALKTERSRANKLEKDLKAALAKIQADEDAKKTDLERAQAAASAAEQKAAELEVRATRAEVVAEKGVPSNLAKFVTGSTREELEAAADELLAAIPAGKPAGPKPDPSQGARGGDPVGKADAGKAEAARRFNKTTQ